MAKKNTRPALVQDCNSTEDHPKHNWRFSEEWPEGVFWHCRGYNREEAAAGARETARLVKKAAKRDKGSRGRARRARKNQGD